MLPHHKESISDFDPERGDGPFQCGVIQADLAA